MPRRVRITARVSPSTAAALAEAALRAGVPQDALVEAALRHHLDALDALPADGIVPPRLVLTAESAREVARRLASPSEPTPAMRALMAGRPVPGLP